MVGGREAPQTRRATVRVATVKVRRTSPNVAERVSVSDIRKLMLTQRVGLALVATPQTCFRWSLRRADKRQPYQIRSTPNAKLGLRPELSAQIRAIRGQT